MQLLLPLLCFGPMAMGLLTFLVGRRSAAARTLLALLTCAGALAGALTLWTQELSFTWADFCVYGLHLRADGFRSLYVTVACVMWLLTTIFSQEYFRHDPEKNRYWFFNLMTLGATLGVFLSDDLWTTFVFFEIMSLTSCAWVAQEETEGALRAAGTYLAVAVIGGLVTAMGLFMLWHELGTLSFDGIAAATWAEARNPAVVTATWLVLFGFAAKAGLFPLHIWLPKAHPVAPAPASALLSGILTKSGVFGLLVLTSPRTGLWRFSPGSATALLILGAITMLLGALLALFSVDLKRTLACSSVSQIGFITVGIACAALLGEEGSLPAYGVIEHMMNHSLIKLCLFMCAGVVFMNLEELNLNRIRGFGWHKPVLAICFTLGALAIGCVPPLGSGFNSKSLLHEGILEVMHSLSAAGAAAWPMKALEVLFIFSGGLTIAYMLKLWVCLFAEKNADEELQEAYDSMSGHYLTVPSAVALLCSALILPVLGLFGDRLLSPCAARSMAFLGLEPLGSIDYFSMENLIGAAESLAVGLLVYFLVVRRVLMRVEGTTKAYVDRWPVWLDMENSLYRPLLGGLVIVLHTLAAWIAHIPDSKPVRVWIPAVVTAVTRFFAHIPDSAAVLRYLPAAAVALTRFVSEIPERIAYLLRQTVFRRAREAQPVPVGNRLTYFSGRALDHVARALNATILRRAPIRTDYEYLLDANHQELKQEGHMVGRSMSFNLLLLALGLLGVCLYLLLR